MFKKKKLAIKLTDIATIIKVKKLNMIEIM